MSLVGCGEDPYMRVYLPDGYGDGLKGRSFTYGRTHYTLADFQTETLQLTLDATARTIVGHAEIRFRPVDTGVPMVRLTAKPTAATLDGRAIQLGTVRDPDDVTTFMTAGTELAADSDHVLTVDYEIPDDNVASDTYLSLSEERSINFQTLMQDQGGRTAAGPMASYFEAYGPAGIEADQFQLSLQLDLVGSTAPHRLFANGAAQTTAPNQWTIEFPAYFSTSSFFVHLTSLPFVVRELSYPGLERDIPITVYGNNAEDVDKAVELLPGWFTELESTFGPYAHASFIADVAQGGGMEYTGATVTSLGAISHELCHSWFARGVMPADGRSGWIDEGIATWRDMLYRRATTPLLSGPRDLANFSMWHQQTPMLDHINSAFLLAEIDSALATDGGLLPVLRTFYEQWRRRPITTEQFIEFLEEQTGRSFDDMFDKYVYNNTPPR